MILGTEAQQTGLTPVLEIGGTHVTAALVHGGQDGDWSVVLGSVSRTHLDAHAPAGEILGVLASAGKALGTGHSSAWGVALPGPFDYVSGIGRYEDVGKFDSLRGVDVRAALADRLGVTPESLTLLNDADAFGIGEYALGATGGHRRAVCITLGTGVGSVFLHEGRPVKSGPSVPPEGSCHLLQHEGIPLEETVSRRAIRHAYAASGARLPAGVAAMDVREIAAAGRAGDVHAAAVLNRAFTALGQSLAPWLLGFEAQVLVVGGSMAGSWDIVEPAIRAGLTGRFTELQGVPVVKATRADEAGLIGAAYWAAGKR